jgi:hypothetical protein
MAFGPYLAAAGWIMLMFGHEIVDRYLGLYGPFLKPCCASR